MQRVRHASLFSGIGGPELAAEWMGWKNVFHCEINPFGRKILDYYWPESESYENIKETNFKKWRGTIDVLTGGFPCQPYSLAGKRKGTDDERHLWPEMLRAIREIQPRWVVGENVFGLIGWNGGLVFDEVQADLEALGYEVQSVLLPACSVNAPHKRDRVFIVAYSNHGNDVRRPRENEGESKEERVQKRDEVWESSESDSLRWNDSNANNSGLERSENKGKVNGEGSEWEKQFTRRVRTTWQDFPTQPPICGGNDGVSDRLDGITFPKWRNESIKAYGNAIVSQLIFQIFKTIEKYDKT
ncbi:MAG: hypothetical protein S4CHLAM20_04420 [Chlamydiia bacterium]|nr:hypothetical protein [Chlamydiia bacterium]